MDLIKTILQEQIRFLRFQSIQPRLKEHPRAYFIYAIIATALAGIGRHWDKPDAFLFDRLGLSSVVYIFVLGTILWLFALPMRPKNWSLFSILIFMGFCGPCAYIYAIPVEWFLDFDWSVLANVVFLGIVSIWRVTLYFRHMRIVGGLEGARAWCALLVPLSWLFVILSYLGMAVVMAIDMGGLDPEEFSPDTLASSWVSFGLGCPALLGAIPATIIYIKLIIKKG